MWIKDRNLDKPSCRFEYIFSFQTFAILLTWPTNTHMHKANKRYDHQMGKRSPVCLRLHCTGGGGEPDLPVPLSPQLPAVELSGNKKKNDEVK